MDARPEMIPEVPWLLKKPAIIMRDAKNEKTVTKDPNRLIDLISIQ
jgi:hypothetical protein